MPDPTVETTLKMTIWTSVWGIDKYVYSAIGLAGAAILKKFKAIVQFFNTIFNEQELPVQTVQFAGATI